ncbi:LLM class flavin-dependent oxidoreductase [Amorphus sp. 3PC139-8]|uniref:LLM class flavin-dependent oxidoreductase n=1 Tax=Amorphus sp. 3PC139-8 TaxID=2735676 RepID=UPI00345DA347
MQFSFSVFPKEAASEFLSSAQRAERAGIDHLWVVDDTGYADPFVLLGALTSATAHIGLGAVLVDPWVRHPMHIAQAAAVLSDLRHDRIVVGLGPASPRAHRQMGISPADDRDQLRSAVAVLRALWAGETVSCQTPAYRLDRASLKLLPSQPVEVHVTAADADAVRLAGEIADGVVVANVATPEAVRTIRGWIAEGAKRVGRDPTTVRLVAWSLVLSADDTGPIYGSTRRYLARQVANFDSETADMHGIEAETVNAVRARLSERGAEVDTDILPNSVLDRLLVVGSAASCLDRIYALETAGLDLIGIRPCADLSTRFDYDEMVLSLWSELESRRRGDA